jgi:predicted AlkP superfamily pyrophosphatase or phosphodiesterase
MIVITISIDGLSPIAINKLDSKELPLLYKIRKKGLYTDHARTDNNSTVTLPNHLSMLTSKSVDIHDITFNHDNLNSDIHSHNDKYITSLFDNLNNNSIPSYMYVGKNKFNYINKSYPNINYYYDPSYKVMINDKTYLNDEVINRYRPIPIVNKFMDDILNNKTGFFFLHFTGTDYIGHKEGWYSDMYYGSLKAIDKDIYNMMKLLDKLNKKYVMIITSDHGGEYYNHNDPLSPLNYTIPFYVYRTDIDTSIYKKYNNDLYLINRNRKQPSIDINPLLDDESNIPIRNGDVGNLVSNIFGLSIIENSNIGNNKALIIG